MLWFATTSEGGGAVPSQSWVLLAFRQTSWASQRPARLIVGNEWSPRKKIVHSIEVPLLAVLKNCYIKLQYGTFHAGGDCKIKIRPSKNTWFRDVVLILKQNPASFRWPTKHFYKWGSIASCNLAIVTKCRPKMRPSYCNIHFSTAHTLTRICMLILYPTFFSFFLWALRELWGNFHVKV